MTHDIVQSDIDLAKKSIKALCSDEEILAALVRRGVDRDSAARLIANLRGNAARNEPSHSEHLLRRHVDYNVEFGVGLQVDPPLQAPPFARTTTTLPVRQAAEEAGASPGIADESGYGSGEPQCPEQPYLWILEILLVGYMILYSGVLYIAVMWIRGGPTLGRPLGTGVWIYWWLRQATAAGFLAYVLYRRAQARHREFSDGAAASRDPGYIRALELGLVLSIAFLGSISYSVFVFARGLPLPEPALTSAGGAAMELWKFASDAATLTVLGYVLYRGSRNFTAIGLKWTSVDFALAIPLSVGALFLANFSYPLSAWVWGKVADPPMGGGPDVSWAIHGPFVSAATILSEILNGFGEEVIVRAYLMTEVLRLTRKGWLAVLCSVSVQVSYHFYQGAPAALGHIGWCLLFSVFYLKTRRVLPLALAHNFGNLTLLLRDIAEANSGP